MTCPLKLSTLTGAVLVMLAASVGCSWPPNYRELTFAGGRLRGFYARCSVTGACGFELSWPGRERFRLPMSQSQASAALQVVAVRDYSGH